MSSDEVEKLKAEVARLREENKSLREASEPSLRGRVSVAELFEKDSRYLEQTITVCGWVRTSRSGGGGRFAFVKIYDGTIGAELQVVVQGTCPGFEHVSGACKDACIMAIGKLVPSKGREQAFELLATSVRLLGGCPTESYPLAGKNLSLEHLRTHQHLRPRSNVIGAVMRIRSQLAFATHEFFHRENYQYVHTPLITASDCEGGGEMFRVTTLIKDDKVELKDGKVDSASDFFKKPSYMTVSGQLNVETYAMALSKTYTFGPTFRAENSHTTRHLAEFWMIEPEIAFADLAEDMALAEAYIKFVVSAVLRRCAPDLAKLEDFEARNKAEIEKQRQQEAAAAKKAKKAAQKKEKEERAKAQKEAAEAKPEAKPEAKSEAKPEAKPVQEEKKDAAQGGKKQQGKGGKGKGGKKGGKGGKKEEKKSWRDTPLRERLQKVASSKFAHVTYTQAIELLQKAVADGHKFLEKVEWGIDLASEHERYLCEVLFQKPTVVTDYPKDIKAFYMRANDDGKTVAAMDVLVPGMGELMGGSQREERLDVLLARMKELDLKEEDYSWYLDLRRFGTAPHAGFGIGFERLVCYVTGMDNIRDVIPFPRYPGHAAF